MLNMSAVNHVERYLCEINIVCQVGRQALLSHSLHLFISINNCELILCSLFDGLQIVSGLRYNCH